MQILTELIILYNNQIYIDERQLLYCMYGESCEMCLALEYLLLGSVIPALIFFSAVWQNTHIRKYQHVLFTVPKEIKSHQKEVQC